MIEFPLSYTGEEVNKMLGLINNASFASSDIIIVSETQPNSDDCQIWIEVKDGKIKGVHVNY